jgi:ubiquinone/menaquinone biosynthesis C-methylase UbiE
MKLQEAVELIKPALQTTEGAKIWAELGCGEGLFTYALATLSGAGSTINAVDKSPQIIKPALNSNRIVFHQLDFNKDALPFEQLDGVLMANSLHFVEDKLTLLSRLKKLLGQDGQLLIIEYEMDKGNAWVPHPVPQASLKAQLKGCGFTKIRLVGERQSVYGGRKMYVCAAVNGEK